MNGYAKQIFKVGEAKMKPMIIVGTGLSFTVAPIPTIIAMGKTNGHSRSSHSETIKLTAGAIVGVTLAISSAS